MIVVHAMYERKSTDERFDFDYLVATRIPFVRRTLQPYGLVDITVHRGISGAGGAGAAKYACIITLRFETLEDLRNAFAREGERMNAGIREFTEIEPIVVVSEVVPS